MPSHFTHLVTTGTTSVCGGTRRTYQRSKRAEVTCPKCLRYSEPSCAVCKDTKKCIRCNGCGVMECPSCEGTGGDNDLPAVDHVAQGQCDQCEGEADVDCEACDGDKSCSECDGHDG